MRSDRRLKAWYRELNRRWFDGVLPDNAAIYYDVKRYRRAKNKRDFAEADWSGRRASITINPIWRKWKAILLWSLLHEMAHLREYQLTNAMDHGETFESIMRDLGNRGAFSEKNGIRPYTVW